MSPASLNEIQEEVRKLAKTFSTKASQDQLLYDLNELTPVKLLGVAATFPVEKIFPIPLYDKSG